MEFIAYDKELEQWVDPNRIFIKSNGEIFMSLPSDSSKVISVEFMKYINIYPYIGRKDLAGNKIYIGDLFVNPNTRNIYEVYFNMERSQYMAKNINNHRDKRLVLYMDHFTRVGHIAEKRG